nr:MAG TPA: hypothetical protein [Caudoviricetes sp.]
MSDSVKVVGSIWASTDGLNIYRIDRIDKLGYFITLLDNEIHKFSRVWIHKQATMCDMKATKEQKQNFEEEVK